MGSVDVLFDNPTVKTLSQFAAVIADVLEIAEFEQRESSNYIDEIYFRGRSGKIEIEAALTDDVDHEDLPYWLYLSSSEISEAKIIEFIDLKVIDELLPLGFEAARIESFGLLNKERRINY